MCFQSFHHRARTRQGFDRCGSGYIPSSREMRCTVINPDHMPKEDPLKHFIRLPSIYSIDVLTHSGTDLLKLSFRNATLQSTNTLTSYIDNEDHLPVGSSQCLDRLDCHWQPMPCCKTVHISGLWYILPIRGVHGPRALMLGPESKHRCTAINRGYTRQQLSKVFFGCPLGFSVSGTRHTVYQIGDHVTVHMTLARDMLIQESCSELQTTVGQAIPQHVIFTCMHALDTAAYPSSSSSS